MKKPIVFVILILLCTLVAFWSPWLSWRFSIVEFLGVEEAEVISGLQVYSLSGELEVFIDDESQGTVTVEESPLIITGLDTGEKLVRIQRISEVNNAYTSLNQLIDFEENAEVVVTVNLGPEEEFSEWHTITPVKKTDINNSQTRLDISIENTTDPIVLVDNLNLDIEGSKASTLINLDKQYTITVEKNGFESQSFKVLPETQEDRDKLKDYNLEIKVYLMYQPIQVE